MDLQRRRAAGELAELFGAAALPSDREMRGHGFRRVAEELLPRLPALHRRWLEAYAEGVNAGLADLGARPPEYLALLREPRAWTAQDSILAVLAMHEALSMGASQELQHDVLRTLAPAGVAEFLMPETGRFDRPVVGPAGDPVGPASIPGPAALGPWPAQGSASGDAERPPTPGSNNWAVAGSRTADGRAILANDMHLHLGVPTIWYHAQAEWDGRRAVGVTYPGVPGFVAGSNGRVAWGFTNVSGDFEDWVLVEVDPAAPERYRVGPGAADTESFGERTEEIAVRGAPAERLTLRTTRWGPVTGRDARGRPLVLKWPAREAGLVNLNILDMVDADSLDRAVEVARGWWGPPQNVLIASAEGRIGWVVSGWIPDRRGFDGRTPASWAVGGAGWAGPIEEARRPVVLDPPEGVLATANARTLPVPESRLLGWHWESGSRTRRIHERLAERATWDERGLLDVQLDTRVSAYDEYRRVILEVVSPEDSDAPLAAARRAADAWTGRADAESIGFRVVARVRAALDGALIRPLWWPRRRADPAFSLWALQDEEPLLRLLEERPAHFLPKGHADWRGMLRDLLRRSLINPATRLPYGEADTWGDARRVRIAHPFSLAVPAAGRLLNMPDEGLPGHASAVRVQGSSFGASERLVVSPGHEEDAILHLPCGQSGHVLSPHYADGHAAWARGEPRPLLAGPAVSAFRLVPAGR
jgi:penicillin amidase